MKKLKRIVAAWIVHKWMPDKRIMELEMPALFKTAAGEWFLLNTIKLGKKLGYTNILEVIDTMFFQPLP